MIYGSLKEKILFIRLAQQVIFATELYISTTMTAFPLRRSFFIELYHGQKENRLEGCCAAACARENFHESLPRLDFRINILLAPENRSKDFSITFINFSDADMCD